MENTREFKIGEVYRDCQGKIIEITDINDMHVYFRFIISPENNRYDSSAYTRIIHGYVFDPQSWYADSLEMLTEEEINSMNAFFNTICWGKNMKNRLREPELPPVIIKNYGLDNGQWNGKLYGSGKQRYIYVSGKKHYIKTKSDILWIEEYIRDKAHYDKVIKLSEQNA